MGFVLEEIDEDGRAAIAADFVRGGRTPAEAESLTRVLAHRAIDHASGSYLISDPTPMPREEVGNSHLYLLWSNGFCRIRKLSPWFWGREVSVQNRGFGSTSKRDEIHARFTEAIAAFGRMGDGKGPFVPVFVHHEAGPGVQEGSTGNLQIVENYSHRKP